MIEIPTGGQPTEAKEIATNEVWKTYFCERMKCTRYAVSHDKRTDPTESEVEDDINCPDEYPDEGDELMRKDIARQVRELLDEEDFKEVAWGLSSRSHHASASCPLG